MKFSKSKKEISWIHRKNKDLTNESRTHWLKVQQESLNKQVAKFQVQFKLEYDGYVAGGESFFCCPFSIYEGKYQEKLQNYFNSFPEATEIHFIESELNCDFFDNPDVNSSNKEYLKEFIDVCLYLKPQDKNKLRHSLDKRNDFLMKRAKQLGYRLNFFHFGNEINWKYEIKIIDVPDGNIYESIDLSDTKPIDRVRYLIELGLVDYLSQNGFQHSTNSMASALSAVTGIAQTSVQPYLNAYLHNKESKHNPMNIENSVKKIKHSLSQLGFVKP